MAFSSGTHPTRAIINLPAVRNNLRTVRSAIGSHVKIMAVVKANGYGHGMVEIAKEAVEWGVDALAVARIEEALALRAAGLTVPILVFEIVPHEYFDRAVQQQIQLTITSLDHARALREVASQMQLPARVHIKVDTGMGRLGMGYASAPSVIETIMSLEPVEVVGLYSHFATSDESDQSYARLQLLRFNRVLQDLDQRKIVIPLKHMANSGAILAIPEAHFTMVRPGIMLYGYPPRRGMSSSLLPVLSIVSRISMIKRVEPKTSISYGRRYQTKSHTRIATVPVGYGDGYSRMLTGKAEVLIHGKRFPVVGTICMDHFMVDIGNVDNIQVGDSVTLLGREGEASISAWDIAEKLGTIPYEVTCMVSGRVPRIYVK